MDRTTRNCLAFGVALSATVFACTPKVQAHTGHVLDHDEVANRLFCSATYAWVAVDAERVGDTELRDHVVARSDRALYEAQFYARLYKHSDRAFEEAAALMFHNVGLTNVDDALAFFEYLDCESLTEESAPY